MINKCEKCYEDGKTPNAEDCNTCDKQTSAERALLYMFSDCVMEVVSAKVYRDIKNNFDEKVKKMLAE